MGFDWAAIVAAVVTGLLGALGGTFLGARLSIRQSKKERTFEIKREHYSKLLNNLEAMANAQTILSILVQIVPEKISTQEYLGALSNAAGGLPIESPGGQHYNEFMRSSKARKPLKSQLQVLHRELMMEALFEFGQTRETIRLPLRQLKLIGAIKPEPSSLVAIQELIGGRADKLRKLIKHLMDGKKLESFNHRAPNLEEWGKELLKNLNLLESDFAADLDETLA